MKNEKNPPLRSSCSIRELAKYVGLSTCTVSKVLNNCAGKKIPQATQQRVLAAARERECAAAFSAPQRRDRVARSG